MELSTKRIKASDALPNDIEQLAEEHGFKADDAELVQKAGTAEVTDVEEGSRTAVQWVTTYHQDRDHEAILPEGWLLEDYKRTGMPVLWGHDHKGLPIGRDLWIKKEPKKGPRGLLAKTQYAETGLASDVLTLKQGQFLNTSSVGFIPLEYIDSDDEKFGKLVDKLTGRFEDFNPEGLDRIYTKQLLLEHSDVAVPSNAHALMEAVSKGQVVLTSELSDLAIEALGTTTTYPCINTTEAYSRTTPTSHKPEVTENYIRIPVAAEEGKHDGHRIRTITIDAGKGIKALYCGECKKVVTYLFDKDKWTLARARAWVRDHKDLIRCEGDIIIIERVKEIEVVSTDIFRPLPAIVVPVSPEAKRKAIAAKVATVVRSEAEQYGDLIRRKLPELVKEEIDRLRGRV